MILSIKVSEIMGLLFHRRRPVPPITLIFGKMAFFDNLLWKNGAVDFHEIFNSLPMISYVGKKKHYNHYSNN